MADRPITAPPSVTEIARAKINLALHVTGRRDDGYHLLDSLVVFASVGDRLEAVRPANFGTLTGQFKLTADGPFGDHLPDPSDNLVIRAAEIARQACLAQSRPHFPVAFQLTKSLPSAAGIGGGSADAAAALRALESLWGQPSLIASIGPEAARLGADIPVCVAQRTARIHGIGEEVEPVTLPHDLPAVLVNPGVPCSTAAVFSALKSPHGSPLPDLPRTIDSLDLLLGWLSDTRNDLLNCARHVAPDIGDVLNAMTSLRSCRFSAMSGSGATCVALFDTQSAADSAASTLRAGQPDWWVVATRLNPR